MYTAEKKTILLAILAMLFGLTYIAPLLAAPDLDVAYISRTRPRYERYKVTEVFGKDPYDPGNPAPYLTSQEAAKIRWPRVGEPTTFIAMVKNPGDVDTGSFTYKWYLDGVMVKSGVLPSIPAGSSAFTSYNWYWDSEWNDHTIKFVADPDNLIAESTEGNNVREDAINALCFRIHVWQSVYDWFHDNINNYDPNLNSFDDWIQKQLGYINQLFKEAVYPACPNGILERVRLDEIVIEPNDAPDQDPNASHAPWDGYWDCRWGFTPKDYPRIFTEEHHYEFLTGPFTWVLHEWGHQMGLFDDYQLDLGPAGNQVKPGLGHGVSRPCMMVGNDMIYCDHTATAQNARLHKRRGWFGEYLYDMPETCRIRLLDAFRRPIPNATINFYQKGPDGIRAPYTFTGTTDSAGYFTMPNRPCYAPTTTATGHTLHDNPFGMIHIVGINGVMMCEVTAYGQTDYQFFEIMPFNLAYRAGFKDTYTYDLQTTLLPAASKPVTQTLYGVKMLSDKLGYAVGAGGTILRWNGSSWTKMSSPTTAQLNAVDAHLSGVACAVGDTGIVLINTHGSWQVRPQLTYSSLKTCAVLSPTTIIVAGESGYLAKSSDCGQTWSMINACPWSINGISFCDQNNGILCTDYGRIYYTADGGLTWRLAAGQTGQFGNENLTSCKMVSPAEAYACNHNGDACKSTDGGRTWSIYFIMGDAEDWHSIDMKPGANGWIVGGFNEYKGYGCIARLCGRTWRTESCRPIDSYDEVYGVSCVSADEAWAVGKGGLLLHLVNDDITAYAKGSLAEVMKQPAGSCVVAAGDTIVTASFPGEVYVESFPDRCFGAKVLTRQSLNPGTLVRVAGIVGKEGPEPVIREADVIAGEMNNIYPLGMTTLALSANTDGSKVNTVPLFIRLAGRVSARNESEGWFTIDDASRLMDSLGNKGVKVISTGKTPPQVNTIVMVNGICTYEIVDGKVYPVVRARNQDDIEP